MLIERGARKTEKDVEGCDMMNVSVNEKDAGDKSWMEVAPFLVYPESVKLYKTGYSPLFLPTLYLIFVRLFLNANKNVLK